ncbi:MAG: lamin tail domain-containing protein [Bacillota bacterium]
MRKRRIVLLFILAALCIAAIIYYFAHAGTGSKTRLGSASIRINEVMTSNKGAVPDPNGAYSDWVEITNTSSSSVDISGFGLSDDKLSPAKWVFPHGTVLEPGGYAVVYCSGDVTDGAMFAGFKLAADDDLVLMDQMGKAIDSLKLTSVPTGNVLARDPSTLDWGAFAEPSPGFANTAEGAKKYRETLVSSGTSGVVINEFMASNGSTILDKNGMYSDWIELYNTTAEEVDLSGYGLSDDLTRPTRWQFPEGTTLPANGYIVVFLSGEDTTEAGGELHAPFSLRSYKEDVVLTSAGGVIVDSYSSSMQEADVSMARVPDGTGAFTPSAQPTPGYPNTDEGYKQFEAASRTTSGSKLIISEMMALNSKGLLVNNVYSDWIELNNSSSEAIDLSGYALTDSAKNPALWVFPEGASIGAGQRMVILASGNNVKDTKKKYLETNFSLSADGDMALLYDPEGKLVDKLVSGAARADMSVGRDASGARSYYVASTPGEDNGAGYEGITGQPQFITAPGIFDGPVSVELSAGSGEAIYYTTDSTTPTKDSTPYTGPIELSKNTVIRAIAVKDGYVTGYTQSGTFLFKSDGVNHALPIATLVTDPKNLWDGKTGIYAFGDNFNSETTAMADMLVSANFYKGKDSEAAQAEWERDASFALFDDGGKQVFSQNIGIRIAGSYGRSRAQKGFNIIARDEYGKDRMAYSFFDNRDYTEYKSVVLRAGAQDQNYSKIRDELACGLLEGTDAHLLVQAYKPYVLYLNGEYWGVYFLKEKRSRFFVAQHEGLEEALDMDVVKSDTRVTYGTASDWIAFMQYVNSHDLSQAEAYDYVKSQVDLESFADYMICEIWAANTDAWNVQYYKLGGGKWKWIYYDFCWSLGQSGTDHQTLAYRRRTDKPMSDLFNKLLMNSEWKDLFVRRFAYMMESVYAPERVNALIDELYAAVQPEIERERKIFNQTYFMGVKQLAECLDKGFEAQIKKVRDFADGRNASIKAQLKSELGLTDAYMQEVFG